jgi:tryptophan synthase beta chain
MLAIFPGPMLEQEMSAERWIADSRGSAPDLRAVAPEPAVPRARLEQMLGTPAKIFYKYEGVSPAGSHKPTPPCRRPTSTRWPAPSA